MWFQCSDIRNIYFDNVYHFLGLTTVRLHAHARTHQCQQYKFASPNNAKRIMKRLLPANGTLYLEFFFFLRRKRCGLRAKDKRQSEASCITNKHSLDFHCPSLVHQRGYRRRSQVQNTSIRCRYIQTSSNALNYFNTLTIATSLQMLVAQEGSCQHDIGSATDTCHSGVSRWGAE